MAINSNFWQGKRVLVTGHTGFKGAWLSHWLRSMGATLGGYALAPITDPDLYSVLKLDDDIDSTIADIGDYDKVLAKVREFKPEIVFHMAAQPLVGLSYEQPVETYQTNVMGTLHVLQALRASDFSGSVIIVTTDKCYENQNWEWGYRESDPMGGYDPYSSSKGCAELLTSSFRNSFFNVADFEKHGVSVCSARAGNVLGGGDWAADRLIPDIIRSFSKGESVYLRKPSATRPWQHVLVPLSGYIQLAEHTYHKNSQDIGSYNFGPYIEDCKSVGDVVSTVKKFWPTECQFEANSEDTYHEAQLLMLDWAKANQRLAWSPKWKLEDTLKRTIEWYYQFYNGDADIVSLTSRQIEEYQTQ